MRIKKDLISIKKNLMKRVHYITLIFLAYFSNTLIAQNFGEEDKLLLKMDATLSNLIAQCASSTTHLSATRNIDSERIQVIVTVNNKSAITEIEGLGAHINTSVGSYLTVDLPVSKVK